MRLEPTLHLATDTRHLIFEEPIVCLSTKDNEQLGLEFAYVCLKVDDELVLLFHWNGIPSSSVDFDMGEAHIVGAQQVVDVEGIDFLRGLLQWKILVYKVPEHGIGLEEFLDTVVFEASALVCDVDKENVEVLDEVERMVE